MLQEVARLGVYWQQVAVDHLHPIQLRPFFPLPTLTPDHSSVLALGSIASRRPWTTSIWFSSGLSSRAHAMRAQPPSSLAFSCRFTSVNTAGVTSCAGVGSGLGLGLGPERAAAWRR